MMIGPRICTSPVACGPTTTPSSSTMRNSTVGTGGPTDHGLRTASSPEITVATDDDSVSPYALDVVRTFGNVSCTFRCNSSAEGEPPNATDTTVDVS
jgi:hypothetical protein